MSAYTHANIGDIVEPLAQVAVMLSIMIDDPDASQIFMNDNSLLEGEQHREQPQQNLPPTESRAIGIATVWLAFYVLAIVNIGVATFSKVG